MAIVAPVSKHKKTNCIIFMAVCLALAAWFAYDGYLNDKFIEKNTEDGQPNDTLKFNMYAPFVLVPLAGYFVIRYLQIKDKKLITDENGLKLSDNRHIAYDSIEKIDKTYFDAKGYFNITYKDSNGAKQDLKLSDGQYDNLGAVLDELVSKIS